METRAAAETALVRDAVADLSRLTRFPVAFGGLLHGGAVEMSAFHGARTSALEGLAVRPGRGLGGRALAELRPRLANDYRTARQITHDYDRYVLGEGIGTLMAVPVVVGGKPRGVIYGASWGQWGVGGVVAAPAVRVAERLAADIRALDAALPEPEAPPADATAPTPAAAPAPQGEALAPALREELRESYAELRRIAAAVPDTAIRSRIEDVERRLTALAGMGPHDAVSRPMPGIRLSPREIDVLACAALGATNAGIGDQLGLREGTVKAYLASAMGKLEAPTRLSAVAKARRLGLLP